MNSDQIITNFFYNSNMPGYLFINEYPVFGIFWNIFLLLVPLFIFKILLRYYNLTKIEKSTQKLIFGLWFLLWLLFVPNSAYIMTDVRHLMNYCPYSFYRVCVKNAWMIIVFFTYALVGWIFFVYLLRQMRNFLALVFNKAVANVFLVSVIPLISLGVLLGLINRWNSWEIFYFPKLIIKDILLYLTDWNYILNFIVFTIFFYLLYFLGIFLFKEEKL